jgi:hypothetical protein
LAVEVLAEERKLDILPGPILYELWNYHERVRVNLEEDLGDLKISDAVTILGNLSCNSLSKSGLPSWLDLYISQIGTTHVPLLLDLTDFHMELAEHIQYRCASCSGIPPKKIREFWEALMAAARSCIAKVKVTNVAASLKNLITSTG